NPQTPRPLPPKPLPPPMRRLAERTRAVPLPADLLAGRLMRARQEDPVQQVTGVPGIQPLRVGRDQITVQRMDAPTIQPARQAGLGRIPLVAPETEPTPAPAAHQTMEEWAQKIKAAWQPKETVAVDLQREPGVATGDE